MMKPIAAILMSLMLPSAVLAHTAKDRDVVRLASEARPLHRAVMREAERLAKMQDSSPAQRSQSTARGGHPVLIGVAIGAGAGFLTNATFCRTGEGFCTGAGNLVMAGIGAGIGAVIGALVSR
jgi:hypothetical protein